MPGAQKALLVIAPEPPPATGMELATQALTAELDRAQIPYVRLDTADPADELGNRSQWTAHNVSLALVHLMGSFRRTFRRDVGAVYIAIAQEFPALIRDLAFISMAHLARKPVVVHLHGGSFHTFFRSQPRRRQLLMRSILGRATLGIVLSEPLRPALECILPPERVVPVPNGLDFEADADGRSSNDRTVRVLFLSVLYPWKGLLLFIEAFAIAAAGCPLLRATIAGQWPSGDTQAAARRLAHQLDVADRIVFTGTVEGDEKKAVFVRADIFCFPSLVPEGQPLVLLEAMAARLPVIAIAWPGVADTVIDGDTGLLVPEPRPELLAEKLVYLAEHPDERKRLGDAGRARYERLYTRRAFGDRMIAALRPVLEQSQIPVGIEAKEARTR